MKIELNEESRFSVGDEIYFLTLESGVTKIKQGKVITVNVSFYDGGHIVEYKASGGYRVPEGSAWASRYECEFQSSWHKTC